MLTDFPSAGGDDDDVVAAGLVFLGAEAAAGGHADAESVEEIPGDAGGSDLLGVAAAGQGEVFVGDGGEVGKGALAGAQLLEARP